MEITGCVTDPSGRPVAGADVLAKSRSFADLATTVSDDDGRYRLDVDADPVPHLVVVKGYCETGLEFWGTDLRAQDGRVVVDAVIDTLELYRLTAFRVEHGVMAYLRPMELHRGVACREGRLPIGEIAPEVDWGRTWVSWDGVRVPVLGHQEVHETLADGSSMSALLVQVDAVWTRGVHRLRVHLVDVEGHVGEAEAFVDVPA